MLDFARERVEESREGGDRERKVERKTESARGQSLKKFKKRRRLRYSGASRRKS